MAQVPDFLPTALWWPEKLIGSIWLSESPSLYRALPPLVPAPLPPVEAATPGTHTVTPVWLQAVNGDTVHVCVIHQGI